MLAAACVRNAVAGLPRVVALFHPRTHTLPGQVHGRTSKGVQVWGRGEPVSTPQARASWQPLRKGSAVSLPNWLRLAAQGQSRVVVVVVQGGACCKEELAVCAAQLQLHTCRCRGGMARCCGGGPAGWLMREEHE